MVGITDLNIRTAIPEDHQRVISVIPDWWGGRDLTASVLKLFFMHFNTTTFVAEKNHTLVGFLVGFLSQTHPNEGYIHFAGVHPDMRGEGLGRALYQEFFRVCMDHSRTIVRSCTAPENSLSINFHEAMGFTMKSGNSMAKDVPVTLNHFRENDPKVLFRKELTTLD